MSDDENLLYQDLLGSELLTTLNEARRFMVDCLKAVGASAENAETVADNLLEADCRGYYGHGMNRLEMYIKEVKAGGCIPNAQCTIDRESPGTAVVNGNDAFGAVVGKFCMDLAIKKAKENGIGLVVAHSSNHYGISGKYAVQAINQSCIGMTFTNSPPLMVPTRAKEAALGTNPIAVGAPALDGDSFVLDMATTAVAFGKIEIAQRKGERIPEGWALNDDGKVETDPNVAKISGKIMPMGGYKGYGLGMFVEIFSSLLSGADYGPNVRKVFKYTRANLGQGFLAVDPKVFAPGFEERMSDLMNYIRSMTPVDPNLPVLVHGDTERTHMKKVEKDGGLIYVKSQHETNVKLADELKVKPMVSSPIK